MQQQQQQQQQQQAAGAILVPLGAQWVIPAS
jgi:hypothetical protein